ncbi:clan AA aspartic protease [Thiorhodovibrio litoralis]|nr:hypothetical protein [Thiorhodovibrio winogradskyi]WPL11830.1 clan AA aspartic protease [Thiorhodovibrio litoralis]
MQVFEEASANRRLGARLAFWGLTGRNRAGLDGPALARSRLGSRRLITWVLVLVTCLSPVQSFSASVDLSAEVSRLANAHGFRVDGSEHLEESRGRQIEGPLYQQLRALLEGFDHIIIQGPGGGVERLLIMGPKGAVPAAMPTQLHAPLVPAQLGDIALPTRRQGNQHLVSVELEGAGARRLSAELLIDTGADALVLPASMVTQLGLGATGLTTREVQTANGRVQARYGRLPAVWLNGRRIADVAVAFLDDSRLGRNGLLGMSVLGRFRVTIDDHAEQVVLQPR